MHSELSKRIYSNEALKQKEGSTVNVAGWVHDFRDLGKLAFIKLRDRRGLLQLVISDVKLLDKVKSLTPESVISASGVMKAGKQKSGDQELAVQNIEIINLAQTPLPMELSDTVNTGADTRIDNRFMDLRNTKITAIFSVRKHIIDAIREFLAKKDFFRSLYA